MQKIEIVITNDAGESSVIASTNRLDANSRVYCTNLHGHEDARKALTVSESMGVSRLCFGVGAHTFAIDPTDTASLAAARAYHEAGGRLKRAAFHAHLDRASGTVCGWPAWKRGILGGPLSR